MVPGWAALYVGQWVEVALRPSMVTFVCDPSYDVPPGDVRGMPLPPPSLDAGWRVPVCGTDPSPGRCTLPMSLAYSAQGKGVGGGLYPNGRPLSFCEPARASAAPAVSGK